MWHGLAAHTCDIASAHAALCRFEGGGRVFGIGNMAENSVASEIVEKISGISGALLREHEPLAKHLSMGVGGPARWFVVLDNVPALQAVLGLLRGGAIPWMILGGGSNTICPDAGYEGLVLSQGRDFRIMAPGPEPHQVTAGAGATLSAVMNFAKRAALSGLEFAAGIPGSLGGALAGNAGTAVGDVCSLADSVEVIDAGGDRIWRPRGSFHYGYRQSDLKCDVIIGATLGLRPDEPGAIQARIDTALAKRGEQPVGQRCSGCMFKNPEGDFAGRLIDTAGLKGLAVGGARVSDKHANFIINDGTASADDICNLIGSIRQGVLERHGVYLELEVCTVGLDSCKKNH